MILIWVASPAKLLARGAAHLGDSVRDCREAPRPEPARADRRLRLVAPEIAVAAGLGEGVPGVEQPRSGNEIRVNRARQPVVGARRVANRRESAQQRRFQIQAGVLCEERGGHVLDGPEIGDLRQGRVEMRIESDRA